MSDSLGPMAFYPAFSAGLTLWVLAGMRPPSWSTLRSPLLIGALVAVLAWFLPRSSSLSALILVLAFLVGLFALGYAINERWSTRASTVFGRVVIVFLSVLLAMMVMGAPLFIAFRSIRG